MGLKRSTNKTHPHDLLPLLPYRAKEILNNGLLSMQFLLLTLEVNNADIAYTQQKKFVSGWHFWDGKEPT